MTGTGGTVELTGVPISELVERARCLRVVEDRIAKLHNMLNYSVFDSVIREGFQTQLRVLFAVADDINNLPPIEE